MIATEILLLLKKVKKTQSGWQACCPAHEDSTPSLSIAEHDAKTLLHCHAGCDYGQILAALGLANNGDGFNRDNRLIPRSRASGQIVSTYDYLDAKGNFLYQIVRIEQEPVGNGGYGKSFRLRRRAENGETPSRDGWVYSMKGIQPVLYNLPAIEDSDWIFIPEGEKDVDTLTQKGFHATCNPFGAGKWRPEYSDYLRGKNVVIVPDNDDAGISHSGQVASFVFGNANTVRIVHLPELPPKGDVTDFFANGGTVEILEDLVKSTPLWSPAVIDKRRSSIGLQFTSLTDLLNEPIEETAYIWENTLPTAGFSICSAKPKVGKSTFARNLAITVSTGQTFLGRNTVKGRVLYLCLEEKRSEIRKHFEGMGIVSDDLRIHTGATPQNVMSDLAGAIRDLSPSLIIIDPLSRVVRAFDFNDYGPITRALEPILDLARESGTHILALHHDSKANRDGGDALLGSSAFFGMVDCHIQLKKREKGRTISTTQRYGEDMAETVIELDRVTGFVRSCGDLKSIELESTKSLILNTIGNDEIVDEKEIKARIYGVNGGIISKSIRTMYDEQRLVRTGDGKKGSPYLYTKVNLPIN